MAFSGIKSYAQATEYLGHKDSRPLPGKKTRLERRRADRIAVKYHDTDVVTYAPDGGITLDTGGWKTATTRGRWNEYQDRVRVYQDRAVWYVSPRCGDWEVDWDTRQPVGAVLVVQPDGAVETPGAPDVKDSARERRLVHKYAAGFIAALAAGKVDAPSAADCWHCLMRTQEGKTLGESIADPSHLREHIKERYYVPALLVRAVEVMPSSIAGRDYMARRMARQEPGWFETEFLEKQLQRALSRYILRQLGQSA